MNRYIKILRSYSIILLSFSFLFGCSGISYESIERSGSTAGGDYIFPVEKTGDVKVTYTLDLGDPGGDVYFILTNTDPEKKKSVPEFSTLDTYSARNATGSEESDNYYAKSLLAQRGSGEITAKNRKVLEAWDPPVGRSALQTRSIPGTVTVGTEATFSVDETSSGLESVDATCRYRESETVTVDETDHTITVNIWVADNCWTGYSGSDGKSYKINSTMIDELGDVFFDGTVNEDIYGWVTSIYGLPWGEQPYEDLISPTNEVDILFMDISGDNDSFIYDGGIAGFFYGMHNKKKEYVYWSNERVMFFMDAVMFAYDDDGPWSLSNPWPGEIVSTLVHEFQHMIHFYQKVVKGRSQVYTDTWIDEMMSMATEDLLAYKLSTAFPVLDLTINGPRGVSGDTLSPGDAIITEGRLPWYTRYSPVSITDFYLGDDIDEVLKSYGASYAFGSWLIRNFDGATVLSALMKNAYYDYLAIADATGVNVAVEGTTAGRERFSRLLRRHAVAGLLSDTSESTEEYMYNNNGSGFTDSLGFSVGSINMFNYSFDPGASTGGFTMEYGAYTGGKMPPASQAFVVAGKSLTGIQQWVIKLPDGIELDIVVK